MQQLELTPSVIYSASSYFLLSDPVQALSFMIYKSAADHLVDPLWPQMVSCPVHWPDPPFLSQTKKVKMNLT